MEKPRVFIGSSSEALAVAQAIHANLEHQCFCEIWTHGVFGINKLPLESLLSVASHTDYAIIVFHPDDLVTTRGKRKNTPRDNVIFELGLFIGKLGKDRTCFVQPRGIDIKIPSDLVGLVCVASSTCGQKASVKMRDFDLLRGVCGWSEANEQRRTATIYGGAEA